MPITKGSGNPIWTWDETLLALDLLYRHGGAVDKSHKDVQALSKLLKGANIYAPEKQRSTFRNPDGVALKLQNLLSAVDPTRGLSSSKTDRKIVAEYPQHRSKEVRSLAQAITHAIELGERSEDSEEEETFIEGQILTSRHRRRDHNLRKKLLEQKRDHELVCAICDMIPPPVDRALRESFFEAHHILPLSLIKEVTQTKVSDMSLLCASCHRFLHKLIAREKRWISVREAQEMLVSHD